MGNNSLISGFIKRAYNGSYAGGYGSIGQGGYGGYYQDSPANTSKGITPGKALGAAGIVGTGALAGAEMRHRGKIKKQMSQARQSNTAAQKKPGWITSLVGGGAMQEHQHRASNAKAKAQAHLDEAKKLRSEGALGWKSKVRDLKSKVQRGFDQARGKPVPKLLPAPVKRTGFKPQSFFSSIKKAL